MTYLTTDANKAFGIYASEELAEKAVNTLLDNGYDGTKIYVLLPDNQATRDFAGRTKTRIPAGVAEAPTADLPLDGRGGFLDMGHHPRQGALPSALRDMGVPADWCDRRVVGGKLLLSVKCDTWDQFFRSLGILQFTSASDISWALSPENYKTASI
jgi:heat induced stress protein YflT